MNKTKHISLRVSGDEYAAIEDAAKSAGRSMSEHLRRSAIDSATLTVPKLNRTAWQELAPVVSNLNQLARRANRFAIELDSSPASIQNHTRPLFELMKSTRTTILELRENIQNLRRRLYGAAPLELAIDVLQAYEKSARTGRGPVSREQLKSTAESLQEISDLYAKREASR